MPWTTKGRPASVGRLVGRLEYLAQLVTIVVRVIGEWLFH
jgi:hypothetical protein